MAEPAFAAVDWGTTRFRAWLLDLSGAVLAERRGDDGLLSLTRDRFGDVLETHLAAMQAPPSLPVVICGMAGSRQGWIEVPYVDTPAGLDEVLQRAMPVPGARRDIRIIAGLAQRDAAAPDVMRGEETQLAGALSLSETDDLLVCMPGTHSKWVEVQRGMVSRFTTWLTGELFSLLASHSILRHSLGTTPVHVDANNQAFGKWLDDGLSDPDAVPRLFRIRASTLLFDMQPAEAAGALSGLLIGSEVASASRAFSATGRKVTLIVSGGLSGLYSEALQRAGLAVDIIDAESAVRAGLAKAASRIFAGNTTQAAKP